MKRIFLLIVLLTAVGQLLVYAQSLEKLDINLSNYKYPYEVSFLKLHIQQQDLQMAYMDIKPKNFNGKNVLLLHGKNFNGAYWQTTMEALLAKGYRVIVPDQIGFGKSSKPENFQYTFQQLALNTLTLLNNLGIDKVIVTGHSMGGMLAARFALMFPQVVEKLVLVNPIGLEDWKLVVPYTSIDEQYKNELASTYETIKKYQLTNYYAGKWNNDFDKWARLLAGWTLSEDYKLIAWNAALTSDMIFTQPVCYEFGNLKMPVLLIIGDRDKTAIGKMLVKPEVREKMGNYKELGKIARDKVPNAQLVEIPGIGHLPHIEAFDLFIKPYLEFLEK